jgi:hypothetical protein
MDSSKKLIDDLFATITPGKKNFVHIGNTKRMSAISIKFPGLFKIVHQGELAVLVKRPAII